MSTALIPHSFLFRFALPVRRFVQTAASGPRILHLTEEYRLPDVGGLERRSAVVGELRLGWNEDGLGLTCLVRGKKRAVVPRKPVPSQADRLRLWIDTRNTQNIHRAGRFCHEIHLYPLTDAAADPQPTVEFRDIDRARESPPHVDVRQIETSVELQPGGYSVSTWLPASVLFGFDPGLQPRLGFFYHLSDKELGDQYLSLSREFPFDYDPGLWQTLELLGD